MNPLNRREFLNRTTRTGLGLSVAGTLLNFPRTANAKPERSSPAKIGAFTKSFQDLPIPEVCRVFKEIGLDGLDLTVRPGGHIAPEDAPTQLPKAVEAAREVGTEILFLTTGITDANADAERLIQVAAEQGVKKIKMGYYRYEKFGNLARQMDDVRKRMAGVAKMAGRYGVLPCVHIHSGRFIPSHGTMLYQLLRDFRPDEVGAYVDPLHMAKEGGGDGWRQGLDLLGPWIALCSVKNCAWERGERDERGQQRWHTRNVPLAEGVCPLPEFTATLKKVGFNGPYSLHSEYKGSHSFRRLDTAGCLKQTAEDLKFFRPLV